MSLRRRRILLAAAASSTATMLAAGRSAAQAPALRRVGVLAPSTAAKEAVTLAPFFAEMRQLGWVEGRSVAYDRAFGDDRPGQLARVAGELAARRPDLIYAPPSPAALAARRATSTIPIVFGTGTDPVGTGLVASLARPGGNVTGVASVIDSLAPKLVELLASVLPNARRIGVLDDPADPRSLVDRRVLGPLAAARGLTLLPSPVRGVDDFDAAVNLLIDQRVDAIVTSTSLVFNQRKRLLQLTLAARVPVAGHRAELADVGALVSYGASLAAQLRRSAHLVDKVLKGASPAEIPIEQPTVFELVINLRTAKAFGLVVPASLVLRADRVIE